MGSTTPWSWLPRVAALMTAWAPLASAILLAASFPPSNFGALTWVALVPFQLSLLTTLPRLGVTSSCIAGAFFHASTLRWWATAYGGQALWSGRGVWWLLFSISAGVGWGVAWHVSRVLVRERGWPLVVAAPAVWTSMEFVRRHLPRLLDDVGFAWCQLAETQVDHSWIVQVADLGGAWLVGAAVVLGNAIVADFCRNARSNLLQHLLPHSGIMPRLIALSLLASAGLYGRWRSSAIHAADGPIVALMPVSDRSVSAPQRMMELLALVNELPKFDLALWTEGACKAPLNFVTNDHGDADVHEIESMCKTADVGLLLGATRYSSSLRRYNSLVAFDRRQGYLGCYDKQRLVPWRESSGRVVLPGMTVPSDLFVPGKETVVFNFNQRVRPGVLRVAPLICFDLCFPEVFRHAFASSRGPDVFAIASCELADDSGRLQASLLAQSQLRAIESRRPIVRNVDGGWSCGIDACGRLFARSENMNLARPLVVGPVPLSNMSSFYVRAGDWFPMLCLGACVARLMVRRRAADVPPPLR